MAIRVVDDSDKKNLYTLLCNISDVNNMLNHTKNIINQLINYQEMYYDRI